MPSAKPIGAISPVSRIRCKGGTGGVTGRKFVIVESIDSNDVLAVVNPGTAGVKALGVAAADAALGADLIVYTDPGTLIPITLGADLAAGAVVKADNQGRAAAFTSGGADYALGQLVKGGTTGNAGVLKLF